MRLGRFRTRPERVLGLRTRPGTHGRIPGLGTRPGTHTGSRDESGVYLFVYFILFTKIGYKRFKKTLTSCFRSVLVYFLFFIYFLFI